VVRRASKRALLAVEQTRTVARRLPLPRAIKGSGADCKIVEFDAGDAFTDVFCDDEAFRDQIGEVPPPVLVLLDVNMPRMSGLEVLEQLKKKFDAGKREPTCFVVLIYTSSNNANDRAKVEQFDFVKDYLVKPIDRNIFKAIFEKYYRWEIECRENCGAAKAPDAE
jgi:CheY-like chemotaxis protein